MNSFLQVCCELFSPSFFPFCWLKLSYPSLWIGWLAIFFRVVSFSINQSNTALSFRIPRRSTFNLITAINFDVKIIVYLLMHCITLSKSCKKRTKMIKLVLLFFVYTRLRACSYEPSWPRWPGFPRFRLTVVKFPCAYERVDWLGCRDLGYRAGKFFPYEYFSLMTGMNFFSTTAAQKSWANMRQMSKFLPRRIYANTVACFGPARLQGSYEEARKKSRLVQSVNYTTW